MVASRLATMGRVQRTLDQYCGKLCARSGALPLFALYPYGSTALGLCEPESDLDICAVARPEAALELVPHNSLAGFRRCTGPQQAKHFLQAVFSPALDEIAVEKKEVFDARVPVLRLSLRQVLETADADEEQRVDITLGAEGPGACCIQP